MALAGPRNTHSADSEATYYQDPEARLKLRVYLASPQKFDEAVEFGFPSQAEVDLFKPLGEMHLHEVDLGGRSTATTTTTTTTTTTATTVTDTTDTTDTTSTADYTTADDDDDDDDDDDKSAVALTSAIKPEQTMPGMREMTLRMTLTRKDLRAYEDDASDCRREPVLTAEGQLLPENKHAAHLIDWAVIDREAESGLKRLWRRVKRH